MIASEAQVRNAILVLDLGLLHGQIDIESPKGHSQIRVQAQRVEAGAFSGTFDILGLANSPNAAQGKRGLEENVVATTVDNNKDTTEPATLFHAAIVQQRTACDFLAVGILHNSNILRRIMLVLVSLSMASRDHDWLVITTSMSTVGSLDARRIEEIGEVASLAARVGFAS